jgi:Ca2+-binding EF-hand superfamily protein
MDEDNSDSIGYYEFADFLHLSPLMVKKIQSRMKAASYDPTGRGWERVFLQQDKDNSGTIGHDEFKSMCRRILKISPKEFPDVDVHAIFSLLDEDGSGEVELQEILDFVSDGTVEYDGDMEAAMAARQPPPALGRNATKEEVRAAMEELRKEAQNLKGLPMREGCVERRRCAVAAAAAAAAAATDADDAAAAAAATLHALTSPLSGTRCPRGKKSCSCGPRWRARCRERARRTRSRRGRRSTTRIRSGTSPPRGSTPA